MAPRGLSADEKKVKMLEIFHETADFYTMKELEKLGPKLKGVGELTHFTVKDIVQELVDDNLVCFDKIGTGNYYWSFPSAAGAQKQAALDKAQKELEGVNAKIVETEEAIKEAQKGREDTADRRKLLSTHQTLVDAGAAMRKELEAFRNADPAKYERKRKAVQVCKDAALRWTDNTLLAIQYATSLGIEEGQIRDMLGISEDWDDLKV